MHIDARTPGQEIRGVLFSLPARVVRLVHDKAFLKRFANYLFDLTHTLLAFRRTDKVNYPESSYIGWFPYWFSEGAFEPLEALTALGRKRRTDWELFQSKPFRKLL